MKILVDADGCPVVAITLELAGEYGVECLLVCDTAHVLEREGARTLYVEKGADSVDFALVNRVTPGDVVITQDYALAAMCLARGGVCIHQNGFIFSDGNIDSLLNQRYMSRKARQAGERMKGPRKRKPEQDEAFRETLRRVLAGRKE